MFGLSGRKKVTRASLRKRYETERKGHTDFVSMLGKLVERGETRYGGISDVAVFLRVNELRGDVFSRAIEDLESDRTGRELVEKWEVLCEGSDDLERVSGVLETREEEIERLGRIEVRKTIYDVFFDFEELVDAGE